jgi:hypothetical protein
VPAGARDTPTAATTSSAAAPTSSTFVTFTATVVDLLYQEIANGR